MLGQHIERALARRRRVLRALARRLDSGDAFDQFEAIGGREQRARRLVEPVICPTNSLQQPACPLWRANIDDEIDVAPVDAEIERRGADHRLQGAFGHRRLDAPPLPGVERAVMQGDRQAVVVDPPQLLKHEFGLGARIDEDQRHFRPPDGVIDFVQGVAGGMAGEGQAFGRLQYAQIGRGAGRRFDERAKRAAESAEPAAQVVRLAHRRRKPDRGHARGMPAQPRQAKRQQIAAL